MPVPPLPDIAPYAAAHASPSGAGDARPTALQVVEDQGLADKWAGRTVLVTGATSGIGAETTKALAATGAKIVVAGVHSKRDGAKALSEAAKDAVFVDMDLADNDSVRAAAKEIAAACDKIHVAVLNAGIMAKEFSTTSNGLEIHFQVNYLGHFLLFHLLRPLLAASSSPGSASRVVALSSLGHHNAPLDLACITDPKPTDRPPIEAYGQSKVATLYLANEIDRRYKGQGIRAFAVSPGTVLTPLADNLPEQLKEGLKAESAQAVIKSFAQGAATSVWAATAKELEGLGGLYLEDERVALQFDPENPGPWPSGFKPYAYDEEPAKELWELSCKLHGHRGRVRPGVG
ncbi:hypothetical protein DFJ74DRAFT_623756 [Hyaloraphidium curvatum]|nr:hypothetical protein DFJ74DRAFT_623756 [Hyaloraphidium curvatum]